MAFARPRAVERNDGTPPPSLAMSLYDDAIEQRRALLQRALLLNGNPAHLAASCRAGAGRVVVSWLLIRRRRELEARLYLR